MVASAAAVADAADAHRVRERLRVLSDATRSFSEAGRSTASLFDAVVHEVAKVLGGSCTLSLLEEDGVHFRIASCHASEPALADALRAHLGEAEVRLTAGYPGLLHVVRTRTSVFIPVVTEAARASFAPEVRRFAEGTQARSTLAVPLTVRGRVLGVLGLARHGPDSIPFDADDLALAEALGEHAALALANAQLLEASARELAERERMAARLRILAEASRDFSEATGDFDRLLEVIVRRLAEAMGDLCGIRLLSDDRAFLVGGAVHHEDPELVAEARALMMLPVHRVGEGLMGRVAATGQASLIPTISSTLLAASTQPEFAAFSLRLRGGSVVTVPVSCRGELIGVLSLVRSGSDRPYTEEDQHLVQAVADHAALAISNARSNAAERLARAEAVRAGAALATSEAAHRLLFDESPLPLLVYDTDSLQILSANDAAMDLLGFTRAEFLRLKLGELVVSGAAPTVRERVDTLGGAPSAEADRMRRKDGSIIVIEYSSRAIELGGARARVAVLKDVTARHEAEQARQALARSERQVRQLQKMEDVGRLAGGIAHDFNNLLSVILSYSDLVLDDLAPGSPVIPDVEEIRRAGNRAAELTRQLLVFSRQQIVEPKVLDLNQVVEGVDRMLRRMIGEDIELVTRPAADLHPIRVDPSGVEQVVLNLAVNARDAMPTGGKLTIETSNVELDLALPDAPGGPRPEPHVMLAVRDTGMGMDLEIQARIFEPFFTTKESGKGTGLGLSTVFGIVQQAGGTVWVDSEPGLGATFKVYFPRATGEVDVTPVPSTASLRGWETILLVEDQASVRGVAKGILERSGYRVLVAESGEEAILASDGHDGVIHLLLTDVVMPHMSGATLAQRLAASRPEMAVVCMSGYTDDSVFRHGVLENEVAFLHKPFTPESLTRKVRQALAAPGRT